MDQLMKGMTPEKIAKVCRGVYTGPEEAGKQEISALTTDSRQISAGSLFVAIQGARVDGNQFVASSYETGALCCMSEKKPEDQEKPYIQVESCLQALKDMAAYYRTVYPVKVIGITGSVGKTTTKEMLASVLSRHFRTLKTLGNFNNEIGLPLTLFRLRKEHEIAVVEMGISEFGEMTRLSAVAQPDACVITNIGQCHLENLGDRDGVLKAKTEIFRSMNPEGMVYLNGDDDKLCTVQEVYGKKPVFFGLDPSNTVYPENIVSKGLAGTQMDVVTPEVRFHVYVPVPGKHMIYNALAAAAVGLDHGMAPEEIAEGIASFRPVDGHSSILETGKFTVMDDCYNANPVSMKAGLDVLSQVPDRKAAILGDMFELGNDEKALHYEVGQYAAEKKMDVLICIGELAEQYKCGALAVNPKQELYYFATLEEAAGQLASILQPSDAILVKASHGMHFEKIVAVLKEM